jgi:hypothetical protein
MKTFIEWLENLEVEKDKNESLLGFLGANHHGPLGAMIGNALDKKLKSKPKVSSKPVSSKPSTNSDDKWLDKTIGKVADFLHGFGNS